MKITTKQAMDHLSKALKEDPEYAFGWHSNIAMACTDAMVDIKKELPLDSTSDFNVAGNEAAARFMKICFDVKTSQNMLKETSTKTDNHENKNKVMTGSESVFGFVAWLTSRSDKTVMSSSDDCASIVNLVDEFCKVNKLKDPRDNYTDYLTHPKN